MIVLVMWKCNLGVLSGSVEGMWTGWGEAEPLKDVNMSRRKGWRERRTGEGVVRVTSTG